MSTICQHTYWILSYVGYDECTRRNVIGTYFGLPTRHALTSGGLAAYLCPTLEFGIVYVCSYSDASRVIDSPQLPLGEYETHPLCRSVGLFTFRLERDLYPVP